MRESGGLRWKPSRLVRVLGTLLCLLGIAPVLSAGPQAVRPGCRASEQVSRRHRAVLSAAALWKLLAFAALVALPAGDRRGGQLPHLRRRPRGARRATAATSCGRWSTTCTTRTATRWPPATSRTTGSRGPVFRLPLRLRPDRRPGGEDDGLPPPGPLHDPDLPGADRPARHFNNENCLKCHGCARVRARAVAPHREDAAGKQRDELPELPRPLHPTRAAGRRGPDYDRLMERPR